MSRLFMIAQTLPFGIGRAETQVEARRTPLAQRERWAIMLLIVSAILGVAYLFVVNSLATTGFILKEKTAHVRSLTAAYESLSAERERLRSWDAIAARLPELDLIDAKKVEYVTIQQPVAFNR